MGTLKVICEKRAGHSALTTKTLMFMVSTTRSTGNWAGKYLESGPCKGNTEVVAGQLQAVRSPRSFPVLDVAGSAVGTGDPGGSVLRPHGYRASEVCRAMPHPLR